MTATLTTYEIRVDGHLDDHWSAWLGEIALSRNDDGTTTVAVPVADQAQLHGVLRRLGDIGAVLTELRVVETPTAARHRYRTAGCTPNASPCGPLCPKVTGDGGGGAVDIVGGKQIEQ